MQILRSGLAGVRLMGALAAVAWACGGDGSSSGPAQQPSSLQPAAPEVQIPDAAPAAGPLPDLVLDAAYLLDTTALDVVTVDDPCSLQEQCVTGLGERRVVRFGSRMGNIGSADFVLGAPNESNPLWTFDSCQMGFDLVGFSRYELRDAASGETVVRGAKRGFCISDPEQWIPESGAVCEEYDCNHQGITPGCADNYGASLPCQWVDVTGVPSGRYELEVSVNADRALEEQDYANNVVTLRIELDADSLSVER